MAASFLYDQRNKRWGGEPPKPASSTPKYMKHVDPGGYLAGAADRYGQRGTAAWENYNMAGYDAWQAEDMLRRRAMGEDSLSAEQLRQGLMQNRAAMASAAASAPRGGGVMAQRTAMQQAAKMGAGLSGQQAMAGIAERQQAANALSGAILGRRGQDSQMGLGAGGLEMKGLGTLADERLGHRELQLKKMAQPGLAERLLGMGAGVFSAGLAGGAFGSGGSAGGYSVGGTDTQAGEWNTPAPDYGPTNSWGGHGTTSDVTAKKDVKPGSGDAQRLMAAMASGGARGVAGGGDIIGNYKKMQSRLREQYPQSGPMHGPEEESTALTRAWLKWDGVARIRKQRMDDIGKMSNLDPSFYSNAQKKWWHAKTVAEGKKRRLDELMEPPPQEVNLAALRRWRRSGMMGDKGAAGKAFKTDSIQQRMKALQEPKELEFEPQDVYPDVKPQSYKYKDPARHGEGERLGIMAQDLEKTDVGKSLVSKGPDGKKQIDVGGLTTANTAMLADLGKRLADLEKKKGK